MDAEEERISISAAAVPEVALNTLESLKATARQSLAHMGVAEARLGILLVDDVGMADYHRRYLGQEGPTDVLTFDLREPGALFLEGEILLSADTAAREARARGHSPLDEMRLYLIHGILHLVGHDDHDEEKAARMHAVEDEILQLLGHEPVFRGR